MFAFEVVAVSDRERLAVARPGDQLVLGVVDQAKQLTVSFDLIFEWSGVRAFGKENGSVPFPRTRVGFSRFATFFSWKVFRESRRKGGGRGVPREEARYALRTRRDRFVVWRGISSSTDWRRRVPKVARTSETTR